MGMTKRLGLGKTRGLFMNLSVCDLCCIFNGRGHGGGLLYQLGIQGEVWARYVNSGVGVGWIVFEAMELDRSPRE